MKTAKEILIEAFHAGRRFGNGTFPIQTFDEWYESNDIEAKVKNLARPDVSGNEALRVALLAKIKKLEAQIKEKDELLLQWMNLKR